MFPRNTVTQAPPTQAAIHRCLAFRPMATAPAPRRPPANQDCPHSTCDHLCCCQSKGSYKVHENVEQFDNLCGSQTPECVCTHVCVCVHAPQADRRGQESIQHISAATFQPGFLCGYGSFFSCYLQTSAASCCSTPPRTLGEFWFPMAFAPILPPPREGSLTLKTSKTARVCWH